MRANFLIPCQFAAKLDDGAPVLFGLFRTIGANRFPALLDPFFIAVEVEADPPECGRTHFFTLQMVDEDGSVLQAGDIVVPLERRPDFQAVYAYTSFRFKLAEAVPTPGVYRLDLYYDDDLLISTRLNLVGPDPVE